MILGIVYHCWGNVLWTYSATGEGFSPEQIARHYPGLSLEKIYATITYYLHKQDELDQYIAEGEAWKEEQYQQSLRDPTSPMQHIRQVRAQHS
ncbi:MAG: DUF433 domain-containing protein [Chloroflexaceae bacterium]|nr:DUF433 domain-containing protein [Chloroflexaceae bacterium]